MINVNVCPNCTEFEVTPRVIKSLNNKGFTKYKCIRCGIEFEYKVTKEPDYKNWNSEPSIKNILTKDDVVKLFKE